MMFLKKLKIGNNGKRVVLVEMKFGDSSLTKIEHYFLVGELPFRSDDTVIKLGYDLSETIRYENEEDAVNAYNNKKCE